jgi:hypothetical protein
MFKSDDGRELLEEELTETLPDTFPPLIDLCNISSHSDDDAAIGLLKTHLHVTRTLGPPQPSYSTDEDTRHEICVNYGCRMYSCVCEQRVDPDTDQIHNAEDVDWFDKSCDVCSEEIEKACYALRRPYVKGGWVGCYCSLECLTDVYNVYGTGVNHSQLICTQCHTSDIKNTLKYHSEYLGKIGNFCSDVCVEVFAEGDDVKLLELIIKQITVIGMYDR